MTSVQTRDIRSFLLTTSFGEEIRAINRSRVRAPRSTAVTPLVRSLSPTSNRKGPNDNSSLVSFGAIAMALTLMPLIVTHGWPGSVIEQLKIIEPLTTPTAHGGSASDAFHLVIPSMPGYGFSGKPTTTGWGPERIARAWTTLMRRLGYKHFVAQGGDWGAVVTDMLGVQAPPELLGIHTNMPGAIPAEIDQASFAGAPAPSGLSVEERSSYEQLVFFYKHVYYAFWMASRPQSMTGFADSPIGLATL